MDSSNIVDGRVLPCNGPCYFVNIKDPCIKLYLLVPDVKCPCLECLVNSMCKSRCRKMMEAFRELYGDCYLGDRVDLC